MDKPESIETPPVKETVQPPVPPPTASQEQVVAQAEKLVGEEKPSIFKRFWYLFLIFGVVIVASLVVLVYGYQNLSQQKATPTPTPVPTPTPSEETDEQTSALEEQGTSDEIEEIEEDLEATDLSEIDQELEDIDEELSSP